MTSYQIDLCYVGTNFHGWQSQPSGNTVQDHLEKALSTFLREPTKVISSSRTDSGVHAEHQVVMFNSDQVFKQERLLKGVNALLPHEIKLQHIKIAPPDFHPITSSKGKLYRYRIWTSPAPNPFIADFVWPVRNLNLEHMLFAVNDLLGKHNFKSFCAKDGSSKTFERNIVDIKIVQTRNWIDIFVLGEGFLKQMVRNMVGTLVDIGLGKIDKGVIPSILEARDRQKAGRTAPATGLSLVYVYLESLPKKIDTEGFSSEYMSFRII